MSKKPVLLLGSGGHAAVLVDILRQLNCHILGLVSIEKPKKQTIFSGLRWFSSDDDVLSFNKDEILLVNALGSLPGNTLRYKLHQKFGSLGYEFMTVISPSSLVSHYAILSQGVQVMPGSIVNANTIIGEGTIVNSGAIVEHDCLIGRHNHIAPRAVLSGSVITKDFVHISTGASVIQGMKIGANAVVAAGANVNKSIPENSICYAAENFIKVDKKNES